MLTLGMHGRKWEIFVSAVSLFAEHGHENVPMRDIAAANGMRAASLYNHFPSKEAILHQIYRFYSENIMNVMPDIEKVLAAIPEKTPHEVLHMSMSYYDEELQSLMDKIYLIAIMQAHRDSRAYEVIWQHNVEYTKNYLRTVLQGMLDAGRIEPLDVESFLELFISFAFTAVFRNRSPHALGMDRWLGGLNALFSLVKEAPRSP